jgi:hypothetical protein
MYPNRAEAVGNRIYIVDSNLDDLSNSSKSANAFSVRVIDLQKRILKKNRKEKEVVVGPIQRKREKKKEPSQQ